MRLAAEAMVEALLVVDVEARRLLLVERAARLELAPGALELGRARSARTAWCGRELVEKGGERLTSLRAEASTCGRTNPGVTGSMHPASFVPTKSRALVRLEMASAPDRASFFAGRLSSTRSAGRHRSGRQFAGSLGPSTGPAESASVLGVRCRKSEPSRPAELAIAHPQPLDSLGTGARSSERLHRRAGLAHVDLAGVALPRSAITGPCP